LKLKEKLSEIMLGATVMVIILILLTPAILITGAFAQSPSNDDFDSATEISSLPFSDSVNTAEATTAEDDPDCAESSNTVWYTFTPDEDVSIEANTFGSDYDTILCLYTGARGNLDNPAGNDDASWETHQSQLFFNVTAGETYFFMIGSPFGGSGGNLVFNVDVGLPTPPPPRDFDVELVSINPTGLLSHRSGIVQISATIECSEPSDILVSGYATQTTGRTTVQGFFSESIVCFPEEEPAPSLISFEGQNGSFVAGRISVNVFLEGCGVSDCDQDQGSGIVRLRGAK
jgi:hypothetical protein